MSNAAVTIKLLHEVPLCIRDLAQIWLDELGGIWMPDTKKSEIEAWLQANLPEDSMPYTYVAFVGDRAVGMCSLGENDGIRFDLTPWLISLVVTKDYQKQGIGRMLIQANLEHAKLMGFQQVYLFAFDKSVVEFYLALDWQVIDKDTFAGHPVTVMVYLF